MDSETIPAGYWQNASGHLIPVAKVKPIDKDRTRVVQQLCEAAKQQRDALVGFKLTAMDQVKQFIARSLAEYNVVYGGKEGNVTLTTFDGQFKVLLQMQKSIQFDERLQAAKALIDECIQVWSKGSNANIKTLVHDAFQVDQAGKISTGRVLGLRRHNIDDERWNQAMQAIADSIITVGTKPYIRFYEQDAESGDYVAIVLDLAALV